MERLLSEPDEDGDDWFVDHAQTLTLLGDLMISGVTVPPEILALDPEDAEDIAIAEVLEAIQALGAAGEPMGAVDVAKKLASWPGGCSERNRFIIHDALTLIGNTPHGHESLRQRYVREVAEEFKNRRRLRLLKSGAERAADGEPAEQVLADIGEQARAVATIHAIDTGDIRTAIGEFEKHGSKAGAPTAFPRIDSLTGGRRRAELTIIAARPGIGKSAMAIQDVLTGARSGRSAAVWSLENSKRQTMQRALAFLSGVEHSRIRDGRLGMFEQNAVSEAKAELAGCGSKLKLFGGSGIWTAEKICGVARSHHADTPIDLIVIDPLSHVAFGESKDERLDVRIGEQIAQFKRLALDLDCHVLLLHHLNRQADAGRPNKAALKNSGVAEETADILIFLWPEKPSRQDEVTAIVEKARDGERGDVLLQFEGSHMRFKEV